MFQKLGKKIFRSVFFSALIFALAITVISYSVIATNLYRTFTEAAESSAMRGIKGAESYINAAAAFTENTATKNAVKSALQYGEIYGVTALLDSLTNYAVKIDGATLYGKNINTVYTAGMGQVPGLNELSQVDGLNEFFLSEEKSFISVRTEAVAGVYNRVSYSADRGVVSCVSKIFGDGGETLGYLFADILPETVYSAKFEFLSQSGGKAFFVESGKGLTPDSKFDAYLSAVRDADGAITKDLKYYCVSAHFDYGAIALFAALESFINRLVIIAAIFVAVTVSLMVIVAFFAKKTAANVTNGLDCLLKRMLKENLPFV